MRLGSGVPASTHTRTSPANSRRWWPSLDPVARPVAMSMTDALVIVAASAPTTGRTPPARAGRQATYSSVIAMPAASDPTWRVSWMDRVPRPATRPGSASASSVKATTARASLAYPRRCRRNGLARDRTGLARSGTRSAGLTRSIRFTLPISAHHARHAGHRPRCEFAPSTSSSLASRSRWADRMSRAAMQCTAHLLFVGIEKFHAGRGLAVRWFCTVPCCRMCECRI